MSWATSHTAGSRRRQGLICVATSGLRPARAKLHKLLPGAKGPAISHDSKDWRKSELGAIVRLAGCQMGALGNPTNPISLDLSDSRRDGVTEQGDAGRATETIAATPPSRPPPPPPVRTPPSPPPVRTPPVLSASNRAPPEPPIGELSRLGDERANSAHLSAHTSTSPPARPTSTFRRRAKTPVYRIGQLEGAARQKNATGLDRMSSVCTIAKEYRELVDYIDIEPVDRGHALRETTLPGCEPLYHDESARSEPPCRRRTLSQSSDDGTVVASDGAIQVEKACLTPPATPPPQLQETVVDNDVSILATRRLGIGLELLTRELSSALASQPARDTRQSPGLQVWVMIEAYERLRDQIAATGTQNKAATRAIESWLEALHAIHRNMADEAAMSESEYED